MRAEPSNPLGPEVLEKSCILQMYEQEWEWVGQKSLAAKSEENISKLGRRSLITTGSSHPCLAMGDGK